MCCEHDTGIEPRLLWLLTDTLELFCVAHTAHVQSIASITDHDDDDDDVWWDQNTFALKKNISFQNTSPTRK